jgi:hypothetical protein
MRRALMLRVTGFTSTARVLSKDCALFWFRRARRDPMTDEARRPISCDDVPASREASSRLEDTGISDGAKLRRLFELEEKINEARDVPMLATACREWQEERAQLLAELNF